MRVIIVECFFCEFWGIWEAVSVGGFWGNFEGEACGFTGYNKIIRFVWLGFVSGEAARLSVGECGAGERLQVR